MRLLLRLFFEKHTRSTSKDQKLVERFPGTVIYNPENVDIGNRVSMGRDVVLSADSIISIGDDTMIGMRTLLLTATHRYQNYPMWKEKVSRPISIGHDVWIGAGSIILPGIKIGNFAVVGAGSVVTRHIPERAIVAGNPARLIRWRERNGVTAREEQRQVSYPGVSIYEDFLPEEHSVQQK